MKIYLIFTVTPEQMFAFSRAEKAVGRKPNALISYYDFGNRTTLRIPKTAAAIIDSADTIFVDSGAFTFRNAKPTDHWTIDDYDDYVRRYIGFLQFAATQGMAHYWVELDIGFVAGEAWLRDQRKRIIDAGLGGGLVNVWHSIEHDWDYWL